MRIVGFVLIGICLFGCSNEQRFFVKDAELAAFIDSYNASNPIEGHRVSSGKNLILAVRRFRAVPFLADSGEYEKISVVVPDNVGSKINRNQRIRYENAYVFWSEGYSARPNTSFSLGHSTDGTIEVDYIDETKTLFTINASRFVTRAKSRNCTVGAINISGQFGRKSLAMLTAWDGAPGTHVLEESSP